MRKSPNCYSTNSIHRDDRANNRNLCKQAQRQWANYLRWTTENTLRGDRKNTKRGQDSRKMLNIIVFSRPTQIHHEMEQTCKLAWELLTDFNWTTSSYKLFPWFGRPSTDHLNAPNSPTRRNTRKTNAEKTKRSEMLRHKTIHNESCGKFISWHFCALAIASENSEVDTNQSHTILIRKYNVSEFGEKWENWIFLSPSCLITALTILFLHHALILAYFVAFVVTLFSIQSKPMKAH